ncbi:MAG: hypothetical protein NT090_01425 [Acidobacteria bacterium]|nr:hypothetical protein [Acidobacteriota bacterium]
MTQTKEAGFETVIKGHLLANGYVPVNREGFDCERAIFPKTVLGFNLAIAVAKSPSHQQDAQEVGLYPGRRSAPFRYGWSVRVAFPAGPA